MCAFRGNLRKAIFTRNIYQKAMLTEKPAQRFMIALIMAAVFSFVGAIGFEIALEFDRYDHIPRDYKLGLWVCDIALIFGILFSAFGGLWGWKDPETFRDLVVIDFFGWVREFFKSR